MAELLPRMRPVMVGASGTVIAVKSSEGSDAALSPIEFVATTTQLYVLPFESEPTEIGVSAPVTACETPPSLESHVTVYAVIASPPSLFGLNATLTELLPTVIPVIVGASGTVGPDADVALGAARSTRANTATSAVERRSKPRVFEPPARDAPGAGSRCESRGREGTFSFSAMPARSVETGPALGGRQFAPEMSELSASNTGPGQDPCPEHRIGPESEKCPGQTASATVCGRRRARGPPAGYRRVPRGSIPAAT